MQARAAYSRSLWKIYQCREAASRGKAETAEEEDESADKWRRRYYLKQREARAANPRQSHATGERPGYARRILLPAMAHEARHIAAGIPDIPRAEGTTVLRGTEFHGEEWRRGYRERAAWEALTLTLTLTLTRIGLGGGAETSPVQRGR